jgi:hypothetical protein
VIYKIPCECGANYIGETGRPLEKRVNEHKRNWLKLSKLYEKDINEENISSLLAAHAAENKHHVKWEDYKILRKENHCKERKIHEAAAMHIESNVINQPSYEIPPLWHSMLREEKRQNFRERERT